MTTLHLEPIISGNANGETILFVQGWPDDASLWDEAVAALGGKYRCVRVNMPNYGGAIDARWGYHTEELVSALVDLIRRVATKGPITLVVHDWGSYWGHAAHHRVPELVSRVAGIDVAPHYKPTPKALAGILAYQSWLFGAFVVGGRVGDWMTRRMARLARAPAEPARIRAEQNYPYRNVWEDLASGSARELTKGYWPTCPLLFMYGERKPFHFHSRRWVDHVQSVGGEVVAVPSGHWVPKHRDFVPTLTAWLDRTASRAHVLNAS